MKEEGVLPLPIGESHKFAPVALGVSFRTASGHEHPLKVLKDVAHVAACVLTGKGQHGLDDRHRGQMMIVTGKFRTAHRLEVNVIDISTRTNALRWQ